MELVEVSKQEDSYFGHVIKGIATTVYENEEKLIQNLQEFSKNCKRKKVKKDQSESEGDLFEDES